MDDPHDRSRPSPLDELFRARYTPMVRLATMLTGSLAIAEELVMDAFERVAPRLAPDASPAIDNPAGYLRTCVLNATRSHHRRRRVERASPQPPPLTVEDPMIDETWERLAELRTDERLCVVLRFYEDLPVAEIAEQLDMPVGTVKSHLHRGILSLRVLLAGDPSSNPGDTSSTTTDPTRIMTAGPAVAPTSRSVPATDESADGTTERTTR